MEVFRDGVWRPVEAAEVVLAVGGAGYRELREQTGVRFSTALVSPRVWLEGSLPDGVVARVVFRRGPGLVTVGEASDCVVHEGRWYPVDPSSLARCRSLIESHGVGAGGAMTMGGYLALKADPAASDLVSDDVEVPRGAGMFPRASDFAARGLAVSLFPYQQVGAEFMSALASRDVGVLLADQMGLGKTAQAIAVLLDQKPAGQSLIVAPASLIANWSRELALFAPGLTFLRHAGTSRTGVTGGLLGCDVVITSYETLVNDLSFMADHPWNVVVLDEAQSIRNPDAQRSAAAKALRRRVSIAVTGTPVENRLMDLWSIAEFVVPALLGSREGFEEAFPDDIDRARVLGAVISPVTLRRLVDEVADDLPELVQQETSFDLSDGDASRYAAIRDGARSAFEAATSLRVLCAHADEDGWPGSGGLPPKAEHALRLLGEAFAEGRKALVFASFTSALDRLCQAALLWHPEAFLAIVDGRVSGGERQAIIDRFMDFTGPGALFLNPQAAGVGLNITAANHVIHFNPEWNPALTSQATARAYRRKQRLPVTVHHLYYTGTVEEDAMERAEWKRELAAGVDDGTAEEATS